MADEATDLQALVDKYDELEKKVHELRHDENGTEIETLSADSEAKIAEHLDEMAETRKGMKYLTEQVRSIREVAEARRQASLVTGGGSGAADGSSSVAVTVEPMLYGCDEKYQGRYSWWADYIAYSRGEMDNPKYNEARERLLKWGQQVDREVADDSKVGRKFEAQIRDRLREVDRDGAVTNRAVAEARERGRAGAIANDAELRAVATGGGPTVSATSGASSFITPVFVGPYVPYREFGRAFADQAQHPAMPAYGMGILKPVLTSGAGVGAYTELGTVTELDPSAGYLAGALGIYTGQVVLSQAVLDRVDPNFRYDLAVEKQIQIDEAPKLDLYVLTKALANANVIPYTGSFSLATTSGVGGFSGVVGQAKKTMKKTVGTVLAPTHLFLDPAPWEYIEAWSDAQGRPVVVPNYAGPFNAFAAGSADGDAGVIEGNTGFKFAGLPAFTDANIPTTGGTANLYQALVCNMNEIEYYESNAVNRILPQTLATNLETIVQRYRYVATIINYNAAVQAVQGSAFGSITW